MGNKQSVQEMSEDAYVKVKQESMAEDIREIKDDIKSINEAINKLNKLEEKHLSIQESILRVHKRLDDHELRIRHNETKLASSVWIERVIWVALAGIISVGIGMIE